MIAHRARMLFGISFVMSVCAADSYMEIVMNSLKWCTMALLLALAAVPAFAADLVSVSTEVSSPTANPGGADEGTVLITNNSSVDVRVRLDMRVVFSNGAVQ